MAIIVVVAGVNQDLKATYSANPTVAGNQEPLIYERVGGILRMATPAAITSVEAYRNDERVFVGCICVRQREGRVRKLPIVFCNLFVFATIHVKVLSSKRLAH